MSVREGNPVSKEIRCQFVILARKDEPTPDYGIAHITSSTGWNRISFCVSWRTTCWLPSWKSGGNPVSVGGNPVSVHHSCSWKSGVSSSFLLEKMNRHRIAQRHRIGASAPDSRHHLEHRVESHIFLCVLAYHLLVAIETTLQRQEIHTSWATVRDLLATHQIATIVLPTGQNGVLRIRRSPTPEPDHRVLYEGLGCR